MDILFPVLPGRLRAECAGQGASEETEARTSGMPSHRLTHAYDEQARGCGKQFEAMIVGQVLKAAREASDGGWLGTDDDQTGEIFGNGGARFRTGRGRSGRSGDFESGDGQSQPHAAKAANSDPGPANLEYGFESLGILDDRPECHVGLACASRQSSPPTTCAADEPLPAVSFRLFRVGANQLVLHVTVESCQCVRVFRLDVVTQGHLQLG